MPARDLIHAARGLRKSPAFTLASILTIALGIGASTAIFSVVNAVLLRPLPYKDADRLVLIESDLKARGVADFPFSAPEFADLRSSATLLEDVSALSTDRVVVPGDNAQSEQVRTAFCIPNFLRMMGGHIVLGRDMTDADAAPVPDPPAGQPAPPRPTAAAVIRYEYWQRRFAGDPNIIGRGFDFGRGKAQVVGVLAPGFELLFPLKAGLEHLPDIYTADRINFATADRNQVFLQVVGRLKPGVTRRELQSQLQRLTHDLGDGYPILKSAGWMLRGEAMQDDLVAGVRPAIRALMGAVLFLLLIACANVANLLLVRASSRGRELAVRSALGGSRWDLIRQMLADSLLIATGGAALGLGLAYFGVRFLVSLAPEKLPRLDNIAIDGATLAFAAASTIAATALCGILPALRASRPDIAETLRAAGRTAGLGGGGKWLRNGVVVAEVALSFVLSIGSGLKARSFLILANTDPGYRTDHLLTFFLPPSTARTPEEVMAFNEGFRQRVLALSGVTAVTTVSQPPFDPGRLKARWGLAEALADPSKYHQADVEVVTPNYFEIVGTRLLEGRTFTAADNQKDRRLIILDRLMAAKAFPGRSAVGQRILARPRTPEPEWFEVIGVVDHQRVESLADEGPEQMYFTEAYMGFGFTPTWVVKCSVDPQQVEPLIRAEIRRFDPRLAVDDMHSMQFYVERAEAQTRFAVVLIGLFAAIAALLASVGLYGVLSSAVRQRTAEIGVRMALGAPPAKIFRMVIGQGLALSAAGVAAGMAAALVLTRLIATLLVGVKSTDTVTYAAMAGVFFVVAAIACWIPAIRAAGLDPTVALREE